MYKPLSPYVKELIKGEIHWQPFSKKTLRTAIKENKLIFVHIGSVLKIEEREAAYKLFRNKEVIHFINHYFIAVAIDVEDIPEATLIGLDLLTISEHKFHIPINIISLPGIKPFASFSSLSPKYFLPTLYNIVESFYNNKEALNKLAAGMTEKLINTGVVRQKAESRELSEKTLHTYIKSWERKVSTSGVYSKNGNYFMRTRLFAFLLKYYSRYNIPERMLMVKQRIDELYYSPMFDPIEGGVFSEAEQENIHKPLFSKSFSENIQAAVTFSFAYKYFGEEIYKTATQNIIQFIDTKFLSSHGGYMNAITLNTEDTDTSTYYKYTLAELKKNFPERDLQIAQHLGMNITDHINHYQIVSNTDSSHLITPEELNKLKKIRKSRKELLYDKRVITSYNCMYASALCIISKNIKECEQECIAKAEEIINHILSKKHTNDNILLFRYTSESNVYLHSDLYDYAFFLNATLLLYKTTKKEEYAVLSRKYTAYILLNFYQPKNGMFLKTGKSGLLKQLNRESVIDYVRFSANSVMARNLYLLHKQTGDKYFIDLFKQQLYNIESKLVGSGPLMVGWALQLLNYLTDKPASEDNPTIP